MSREYPEHPMVGVGALIKKNGSVLLVKREHEPGKGRWSLPGGLVNLGERVVEAVKREVEEEVGLRVEVVDLIDVFDSIMYDDESRVRFHYVILGFEVRAVGGEVRGSEEASLVHWFKAEELRSLRMTSTTKRLLKDRLLMDLDNQQ
ncbi:MAG: NUDIX hydrolase [Candidatus Methylarchaceae archaeon HK02M1]|nr:NUDIX hydrolase [Candidatus Methylarchaceae archaeon HK02M1]